METTHNQKSKLQTADTIYVKIIQRIIIPLHCLSTHSYVVKVQKHASELFTPS